MYQLSKSPMQQKYPKLFTHPEPKGLQYKLLEFSKHSVYTFGSRGFTVLFLSRLTSWLGLLVNQLVSHFAVWIAK